MQSLSTFDYKKEGKLLLWLPSLLSHLSNFLNKVFKPYENNILIKMRKKLPSYLIENDQKIFILIYSIFN